MANELFPIFLRADKLKLLVVGGGFIGLEKVSTIFRNSNNAQVTLVAPEIRSEIRDLSRQFPTQLLLVEKAYDPSDLNDKDVVIAATSIKELNKKVYLDAKAEKILINVADTPDICDFYMSSIVKKGDLKIAISSNGKSPTITKRIRELLEEVLPGEIDDVLENLNQIRDQLKGDFEYKLKKLDEITSVFKEQQKKETDERDNSTGTK